MQNSLLNFTVKAIQNIKSASGETQDKSLNCFSVAGYETLTTDFFTIVKLILCID